MVKRIEMILVPGPTKKPVTTAAGKHPLNGAPQAKKIWDLGKFLVFKRKTSGPC